MITFINDRPVDIICMGRVAVDLYSDDIGSSLANAHSFKKYLGGCAGNIAIGTARLGLTSMMFSCVGKDEMGRYIQETLRAEGVLTDLLYETPHHLTGLVLLGVNPPKEFPLMFYRENCADMQLQYEHVKEGMIAQTKSLLITGTALSKPSIRETSWYAATLAKKHQTTVIMDLDYRPVLWGLASKGDGETRYIGNPDITDIYQKTLPLCDLIVGTEEEVCLAGGSNDLETARQNIQTCSAAVLVIKLGERGCIIHPTKNGDPIFGEAFPVEVLNILGAGDAFMSGLLCGILRGESLEKAARYANACGALVVTRHGCAPAIPSWQELNYFMTAFMRNPTIWKSKTLEQLHTATTHQDKSAILIKQPLGFQFGINSIVNMETTEMHGQMNFSSIKLKMGQSFSFNQQYEFAALLLTGRVIFNYANQEITVERVDFFRQAPIVLHCSINTQAEARALTDCELLLIETINEQTFSPLLFDKSNMLELDHRGLGSLDNTSYRHVRTVFDKRNRPESNLVVGEILTMPGRWSSYPPHYHNQPEIYHYRFSEPQGFSFGEHGAKVLRIEHNDTYQILQGGEHAHCVAPGYALYTLWFIRHLQNEPYSLPTFREEHAWTREKEADWRAWSVQPTYS